MGQKVSDLRSLMLTMESEGDLSSSAKGDESPAANDVDNGNEGQPDQHFEIIYSNRNEPSTSSGSSDAANGNSDAHCACAGKSKSKCARKRSDEQAHGAPKRTTLRSMPFTGNKKARPKRNKDQTAAAGAKKRSNWGLRLNCARLRPDADLPDPAGRDGCVCTGYRRTAELASPPVIDLGRFNPDDFPIEDCDERARLERAREMAEGVEPPPGFAGQPEISLDSLAMLFQTRLGLHALSNWSHIDVGLPAIFQRTHSQADFIHCLVPDLLQITNCSYYWGKMDRYEAERLLEGRPEGTFLLRDSAQEEILFSVSFRKYGRSLHARIEQWNHRFSFDSHDPGVYASPTVCGLIEHYKDSSLCMFFEPMLTIPLHRNFPFPLQHLCRAAICSAIDYDSIARLHLPKALKSYLREYHYKQRVRVRNLDTEL